MKTLHQVSLTLRDLEKNLSSSFLVLSDKLIFVAHLLLASVHFLRQVSSSWRSESGGVAMLSAES